MKMTRVQKQVTLAMHTQYERAKYVGYGTETVNIYKFTDEEGTAYVWRTTARLCIEIPYVGEKGWHSFEDSKGNPIDYSPINRGDTITIAATIKGETEYKGEPQIEIQRVKVLERSFKAETEEERKARIEADRRQKAIEQIASIGEGDFVWKSMPYKQYKDHYADCEVVEGSFNRTRHGSFVDVIVRRNRLVKSGVRGKHFKGYQFTNEKGEFATFRAVSEENARKQLEKEGFKGKWECTKIYDYR